MEEELKVSRGSNFCGHREGVFFFFCDWELESPIESSCGDESYFNLGRIPSHNTQVPTQYSF